ncbi:MAG: class I SAM-dependent RNA methyltransferase [Hyphomicrobium sp.]
MSGLRCYELKIDYIGYKGHGVSETEDRTFYLPYTLPGEKVRVTDEGGGTLEKILEESLDRIAPVCRHFGVCGGCALQHMAKPAYLEWKREQVIEAFRARGIREPILSVIPCTGKRRRAAFSARRTTTGVMLGFHEAGTHNLVDVQECVVLHPAIVAALPGLRALLAPMLSRRGEARVVVTWTEAGLDVALSDMPDKLTPEIRTHIASAARAARIVRVSVESDVAFESLTPFLKFGRAEVSPPPGVFLQAVAEAETVMGGLIVTAIGKAKTAADLFCGVGAFTFRLAERAKVFAADSDKVAITALIAASKNATGLKPIEAITRDLFREPLSATEMNGYDAVVFDPPRAGAESQARMIAKSKVKTVVAVSCNPATLARDARVLMDGGYKLETVTPIDQFLYTPHIEVVAVFRR